MSDLEQLKHVIRQSSELSKLGEDEKALALIDDVLAQAVRENRVMWVRIWSKNSSWSLP
jgi:hypothetical protein